jgi:hypothetical protein
VLSLRDDPFPTEVVRDLLGIARALHRLWSTHGDAGRKLAQLKAIGTDLRTALELAAKCEPGTIGHGAAWNRAERGTKALAELIDAFEGLRPVVLETAKKVRRGKR